MSDNKKDKSGKTKIDNGSNQFDRVEIAIPDNGKIWVISSFGAGDIGTGDLKSSLYWLEWDGAMVEDSIIVVTGVTQHRDGPWEFMGDGVKKLEVYRERTSKDDKDMPWWIRGYQRS